MKVVAFDTETRGLDWFNPDQRAFLASWADADGQWVADLSDPAQVSRFLEALEEADTVVAHNLSFDAHMVRATLDYDLMNSGKTLHDTDIMSRVLFPEGQRKGERGGHGLKNLVKVHLGVDNESEEHIKSLAEGSKIKLKSTGGYYDTWRAYPEIMEKYAADDARFTYDLFMKFREFIQSPPDKVHAIECYGLERKVWPVLIEAERVGVAIDPQAVNEQREFYELQLVKAQGQLEQELGTEALGGDGSEQALLDALERIGVKLYRKTDTGKLKTDRFALAEFEKDFPILEVLSDHRQAKKFLSTYIEPMVNREVVHPNFIQCGAWTGRMSCMRPNMQNIPKAAGTEVRSMFVPRDGHCFIVCDYDSIEVRFLAYYMNDEGYIKLIEDGHDPHAWMATNIHGGEMESYLKGTDGQELRDDAKNTLFAITYGAGAPRVSDMNGITKDEAKVLIRKIKSSLPGYYRLMERVKSKIKTYGYITTIDGRKQVVNKDKAYVGLNALIQGSAAGVMKQGLVNTAEAVKTYGATPLLVVHDEIVVETPTGHAEKVLELTKQAMESAYDLRPALKVSGKIVLDNYSEG